MPMTINVGLSRKASRDYQSTGVSINVTAELDSALLQKPEKLQAQIDGLYSQAQQAMDRQVQACRADTPAPAGPWPAGPGCRARRSGPAVSPASAAVRNRVRR